MSSSTPLKTTHIPRKARPRIVFTGACRNPIRKETGGSDEIHDAAADERISTRTIVRVQTLPHS